MSGSRSVDNLRDSRHHKGPIPLVCGILVMLTLVEACAFVRGNVGDEFRDDDVKSIQKGATTKAEVSTRLGAPDRIIEANGHEIFQYYRYDIKAGNILFFSRINVKSDDLYVFFNREGVVDDVVFGKRTDSLKFQVWPFGQ